MKIPVKMKLPVKIYRSSNLSKMLGLALALSAVILCSRVMAQTENEETASQPDIVQMIKDANAKGANTKERYEALARYYDEQAKKARKEGANYKAQADCFVAQEQANKKANITLGPSKLSSFCYRERKQYQDIAKEDEALAKTYRDIANEVAEQAGKTPANK